MVASAPSRWVPSCSSSCATSIARHDLHAMLRASGKPSLLLSRLSVHPSRTAASHLPTPAAGW